MVQHVVWAGNQPSPQQPRSRCALFLPLNSFWRLQCLCLLTRVPSVTSTKSLFTVSQSFKGKLFMCKTALVRLHAQTKHRPSLKAAYKMPSVEQTGIQNGRRPDERALARVWDPRRVFSVDWDVGSIPMTDPYRRQIKPALFWGKQADRGCMAAPGLSQAAILKPKSVPVHRDWGL